jgi:hypothetical protein
MTNKRKQQSAPAFARQFIVPFSLEECRARLEAEAEKASFWAAFRKPHVQVETWDIDANTVGFRVFALGNALLSLSFLAKSIRAYGKLSAQADGTTHVWVNAGSTPLVYGLLVLLFVVLLALMALFVPAFGGVVLIVCGLCFALTLAAWMTTPRWFQWYDQQHINLQRIVEIALPRSSRAMHTDDSIMIDNRT